MVAIVVATLVSMLVICLLAIKVIEFRDSINTHLGYVKPAIQRMIEPPRVNPQSYAVNRPQTAPVSVDKLQFEPTDLTPEEVVQLLALITVVRDGERRQFSQDIISRAAGISKVTAAAMIAEARGVTPEPLEAYDPAKHIKTDGGARWITR